jgi:peptide chain release factor
MGNKIYLQITSGRGPAECCRVVAKVTELILKDAGRVGLISEVIDREEGELNRTLLSAVISVSGDNVDEFASSWVGTIQWIAKSPYRKFHKRKNWFIGVQRLNISGKTDWDENEVQFQTMKASGPGGQHVNKTESAVRAIHKLSGVSVTVSDNRSQMMNKKAALERLRIKLIARDAENTLIEVKENWQNHNVLQRGNPIKTICAELI